MAQRLHLFWISAPKYTRGFPPPPCQLEEQAASDLVLLINQFATPQSARTQLSPKAPRQAPACGPQALQNGPASPRPQARCPSAATAAVQQRLPAAVATATGQAQHQQQQQQGGHAAPAGLPPVLGAGAAAHRPCPGPMRAQQPLVDAPSPVYHPPTPCGAPLASPAAAAMASEPVGSQAHDHSQAQQQQQVVDAEGLVRTLAAQVAERGLSSLMRALEAGLKGFEPEDRQALEATVLLYIQQLAGDKAVEVLQRKRPAPGAGPPAAVVQPPRLQQLQTWPEVAALALPWPDSSPDGGSSSLLLAMSQGDGRCTNQCAEPTNSSPTKRPRCA